MAFDANCEPLVRLTPEHGKRLRWSALEDQQQPGKERSMASNRTRLDAAHASVRAFIGEKLKYLVPMTVLFMTCYVGLTVLSGFARDLVGMKVVGPVNLGFALIALNYLLSWLLALRYGRIAQSRFDPLAARAVLDASEGVPK